MACSERKSQTIGLYLIKGGKLSVESRDGSFVEYRGLAEYLSTALAPEEVFAELTVFEQLSQDDPDDVVCLLMPVISNLPSFRNVGQALNKARNHLWKWKAQMNGAKLKFQLHTKRFTDIALWSERSSFRRGNVLRCDSSLEQRQGWRSNYT